MNSLKLILIGFAIGVASLAGCQKIQDYFVPPKVETPVVAPATTPTIVPSPVATAAPAPSFDAAVQEKVVSTNRGQARKVNKKSTTKAGQLREELYGVQGEQNAEYAKCLNEAADGIIEGDIAGTPVVGVRYIDGSVAEGDTPQLLCTPYKIDVFAAAQAMGVKVKR